MFAYICYSLWVLFRTKCQTVYLAETRSMRVRTQNALEPREV